MDQHYVTNRFDYVKILVSPLRRSIQTAIDILAGHRQIASGACLVLYPYLTERINDLDSVPLTRRELTEYTAYLEAKNDGLVFDYTFLDALPRRNLWFVEILQDESLKKHLLSELLEEGERDCEDNEKILSVLKATCQQRGLEGIGALYRRVSKLKRLLK